MVDAALAQRRRQVRRAEGKLRNLEETIRLRPLDGTYGTGHTRWATHGHRRTPTRIAYGVRTRIISPIMTLGKTGSACYLALYSNR